MPTASREAMQATDEPVELIRQELVETDRMCRYYGYLAQRLVRLGELLQFGLVAAPLAAIAALLSAPPHGCLSRPPPRRPWPRWSAPSGATPTRRRIAPRHGSSWAGCSWNGSISGTESGRSTMPS